MPVKILEKNISPVNLKDMCKGMGSGEDSRGDPWIHFPLWGRIWLTPCKAGEEGGGREGGKVAKLEWGGNTREISSHVDIMI